MNAQKYCIPSPLLHSPIRSTRLASMVGVLVLLGASWGCGTSDTNSPAHEDVTNQDVASDAQDPPPPLLAASQIEKIETLVGPNSSAMIVAVVDGNRSQIYSFGELDSGEKPDGQTLFELGDTTKSFSALLLADAVLAGELTLEQPVQELLPDFEIPTRNGLEISVEHLATEHSGLPSVDRNYQPYDPANPYVDYELAMLKSFLADHELESDPGTNYSNGYISYALLGYALEEATNTDYATLIKTRILEPLGMSASVIDVREADASRLAQGHANGGRPMPNWDFGIFAPSSGLVSNGEDMLRYLKAHLGQLDTPLYPAMQLTHQAFAEGRNEGYLYGLGWEIMSFGDHGFLSREGRSGGYASYIGMYADGSRGVVILSNIASSVSMVGMVSLFRSVDEDIPGEDVSQEDESDADDADTIPDVEESEELLSDWTITQFERAIEERTHPAILVAVVDGERSQFYSFGTLDSGEAPDGQTLFELGFITKTFTGLLLADAIETGEVTLEQPVQELLPDFEIPTRNGLEITLEHLATHRSGLPDRPSNLHPTNISNPYADYNVAQLKSFLAGYILPRDPGALFEHSNVGYAVLGYALGERANSDYATLLEARIFEPLGMVGTLADVNDADPTLLANGHSPVNRAVVNWEFSVLAPIGAVVSNGDDMMRYLKANMGLLDTPLSPAIELAKQPRPPESMGVGLGWTKGWSDSGYYFGYSGLTSGHASYIGFMADGSRGVVVLTNISSPVGSLGMRALTD